jgi:hypothetical protein
VTEAGLIRAGSLVVHEDIVRESPWPGALGTWTPIGYREVPVERDAITPVYPPGFPLLIALLQLLFGFCGTFWVVPLSAGATVWLTYLLGRRVFERSDLALAGAVLVAASPVFLYESMATMSDVPATAAWTLALVLALGGSAFSSGLAAAAAIMIRPNLAPVAGALILWTLLRDLDAKRSAGRRGTSRCAFLRELRRPSSASHRSMPRCSDHRSNRATASCRICTPQVTGGRTCHDFRAGSPKPTLLPSRLPSSSSSVRNRSRQPACRCHVFCSACSLRWSQPPTFFICRSTRGGICASFCPYGRS